MHPPGEGWGSSKCHPGPATSEKMLPLDLGSRGTSQPPAVVGTEWPGPGSETCGHEPACSAALRSRAHGPPPGHVCVPVTDESSLSLPSLLPSPRPFPSLPFPSFEFLLQKFPMSHITACRENSAGDPRAPLAGFECRRCVPRAVSAPLPAAPAPETPPLRQERFHSHVAVVQPLQTVRGPTVRAGTSGTVLPSAASFAGAGQPSHASQWTGALPCPGRPLWRLAWACSPVAVF